MTVRATFERILLETPLPRSSHSISVVRKRAYLFGGEVKPREPVDSAVHVFDLSDAGSDSDSKHASSTGVKVACKSIEAGSEGPALRVGHTAARINDDIYIFGGRGGKDMTALQEQGRLWKFSTTNQEWQAIDPSSSSSSTSDSLDSASNESSYPEARSYHSSTSAQDLNQVFIHAGCPASGRESDLWSFNIESRKWKKLENAPLPARGGPGFTYALGKLWRYGGFDGKNELGGQLDFIDVSSSSSNKWQSVKFDEGNCPGPRSVGGLQVIYVKEEPFLIAYLGERDASNLGHAGAGVFWGDVWALALTKQGEIARDKWEKCIIQDKDGKEASLPERGWFASDTVGKDKILVYGGLNARNERENDGILISFS